MQSFKAFFAMVVFAALCTQTAMAQTRFGAQGAEGEPDRMQQWLGPPPDPDTAAHALLFRPPRDGPSRLAVSAPAPTPNLLRRAQTAEPESRASRAWQRAAC